MTHHPTGQDGVQWFYLRQENPRRPNAPPRYLPVYRDLDGQIRHRDGRVIPPPERKSK